jgi:hypothetical protein
LPAPARRPEGRCRFCALACRCRAARMMSVQMPERTLADRLGRQIRGSRSRAYWLTVLVLAAIGAMAVMLWPVRRDLPLFSQPQVPRPEFRIVKVTDVSTRRLERLNLTLLVRPGMPEETLEAAIDWALYTTLNDYNGQRRHRVRTIWAYVVEDSALPLSQWRALAIWTDPKLPKSLEPAHSGGDAKRVGPVEYDFTNPLRSSRAQGTEYR